MDGALKAHFHPWCIALLGTFIVLHEIPKFFKAHFHRFCPKQSLEYCSFCSFSCCKHFLLLFLKVFCKYSVYVRKFCSLKTMCVWRNAGHYTPSCWKTKATWLFEVDAVEGICFNCWKGRKEALEFSERTDSEFAEFLLHRPRWGLLLDSTAT